MCGKLHSLHHFQTVIVTKSDAFQTVTSLLPYHTSQFANFCCFSLVCLSISACQDCFASSENLQRPSEMAEPSQSLSLCKYLTEEDSDYMMGDYNLVMAPLYHWWEKMQQKCRESGGREEAEHTMWDHLGSCASLTKSRHLRREPPLDNYNIGIFMQFIK